MLFYKMKQKKESLKLILEIEQKRIGMRFKQLRKARGYSSHEMFAYDHGLDRAQYGKIEAGAANMTLKVFIKHLNAIEGSFSEFFNEDYENIDINDFGSN